MRGLIIGALVLSAFLAACTEEGGSTAGPDAGATATSPAADPAASMTPTPVPAVAAVSRAEMAERMEAARRDLEAHMAGFPGRYTIAAVDTETGATMTINGDLAIYAASSGKIVVAVGVLRKVERGDLDFEDVREDMELMMRRSLDANTDALNALLTQAETDEVLRLSGVSPATYFRTWRYAAFTSLDLARVWGALLEGRLLGEEWTAYLLDISGTTELPDYYATFPARLNAPGFQYGQKPGYFLWGSPYTMAAGAFVRPDDGSHSGIALSVIINYRNPDVRADDQRLAIFPILLHHLMPEAADAAGMLARQE